jgi:hypothetical protein
VGRGICAKAGVQGATCLAAFREGNLRLSLHLFNTAEAAAGHATGRMPWRRISPNSASGEGGASPDHNSSSSRK